MVPAAVMPVSATEVAAKAGAEAMTAAKNIENATKNSLDVVEVVHICGDGILTTSEECDDGANIGGDGCSGNCTIEEGYICKGSLRDTSECYEPEDPILAFSAESFGPYVEGTKGFATVRRLGWNGSAISVSFSVASSTAYLSKEENDVCASSGDFNFTSGIISFAIGEIEKKIYVPLLNDNI